MVKPTIVAGINSLGRGQDVQALGAFLQTIAQTMGPEAIQQYINPEEVVKRLAAAQGIDVLNLVKSMEERQQEQQQAQQQAMQMEALKQEPNMMKAPINDPSKNPALAEQLGAEPEGEGEAPPQPPQ
jgi:cell division protein FtsB